MIDSIINLFKKKTTQNTEYVSRLEFDMLQNLVMKLSDIVESDRRAIELMANILCNRTKGDRMIDEKTE